MKLETLLTGCAMAGAMLIASTAARAATIVNGSFELNTLSPSQLAAASGSPGFVTLDAGNTELTGWTISGDSVDYVEAYWMPQDGNFSLDMSGDANGAVSQTLSTVAGRTYDVSFYLAGNPDGPPTTKVLGVDASGQPTEMYMFDTGGHSHASMGWELETYQFTATSGSTVLTFSSLDGPGQGGTPYGPTLDDVSITAIPEPASWALMIMGAGFIGAGMRWRLRPAAARAA